jgi:hypothetical protein
VPQCAFDMARVCSRQAGGWNDAKENSPDWPVRLARRERPTQERRIGTIAEVDVLHEARLVSRCFGKQALASTSFQPGILRRHCGNRWSGPARQTITG